MNIKVIIHKCLLSSAVSEPPYLQQCRETLTLPTMHGGTERHRHTHSDRAGTSWWRGGWGRGRDATEQGDGERDGDGGD